MASTSKTPKPQVSEEAAHKMADEWEAEVTRLIAEQNDEAWNNAQPALYDALVS